MRDIYLRFSSKEEMRHQLLKSGFEENDGCLFHQDVCLDIVGVIYSVVNESAEEPEYIADEGWHTNIRIIDDRIKFPELLPFIIEPKSPSRVWA